MLITDAYRQANIDLHRSNAKYGTVSGKHAARVRDIVVAGGCASILDYGCGKGVLAASLQDLPVAEYDPAIPGKDAEPAAADLVVCTDVLEHIEPDCLAAVLAHLHALTRRLIFGHVSTRAAVKFLADGRNAHLIVEAPDWWRSRLEPLFEMVEWSTSIPDAVVFLGRPRQIARP